MSRTILKLSGRNWFYHLVAFVTVAIWGSTFVFTKMLLQYGLTPAQIFTLRFLIAYVLLAAYQLISHSTLHTSRSAVFCSSLKDELLMVLLGITGGSVYFLTENAAMLFTTATNTSLIVCSCPLFTMLLVALFYRKSERFTKHQVLGSVMACMGMAAVVLNGRFVLHLSPKGDLLAFAACLCWAFYSLLMKAALKRGQNDANISSAERLRVGELCSGMREQARPEVKPALERCSALFITRKVFFYGLLTMIPYYILNPDEASIFSFSADAPLSIVHCPLSIVFNLLFLAVVASLGCYLVWNWVIKKLGAVVATNWVYFNPITTIVFAWWLLHEQITVWFLLGTALILVGMFLADRKSSRQTQGEDVQTK